MKFKNICGQQIKNFVVKKSTSISLVIGLLLNPTLTSFAGTWSEDGRYETFEGSSITVDNTLEEDNVDIEIEGNTMYYNNDTGELTDTFIEDANLSLISSFEDAIVNGEDGENSYNVEVVYKNKNLFDGELERGTISTGTGIKDDSYIGEARSINFIEVLPNSSYSVKSYSETLSGSDNVYGQYIIYQWDKNKNYLGYIALKNINSFTTNSQAKYIKFRMVDNNLDAKIQLEKGSSVTEYVPYQSNTLQIPLSEPLRNLPNGIGDRIIKKNGQWYIERNCAEVTLDGSESGWTLSATNNSDYNGAYKELVNSNNKATNNIKCDKLKAYSTLNNLNSKKGIHENAGDYGLSNIVVSVPKSECNSLTGVEGVQNWLQNNPIKVVYQLAIPIYEPLNINSTIDTYLDITHVSNNSTIPANMKVTVDRVANRAKEAIELLNSNPTIDNISQARYWSNLMKESTLKDDFQSEIDNITDIDDLTIEKKTASVNADIYIKMKNTLSLSLDTNSIMFDEVDITEDTEKLKAVNLTVSSSLPYKINAYLEDEIYNSDKSEILDKSVLNIKANENTTYQAFSDLLNPIILLDDQEAGVEIAHGVDLKLASNDTYKADIYKTTIKFEVVQK